LNDKQKIREEKIKKLILKKKEEIF